MERTAALLICRACGSSVMDVLCCVVCVRKGRTEGKRVQYEENADMEISAACR